MTFYLESFLEQLKDGYQIWFRARNVCGSIITKVPISKSAFEVYQKCRRLGYKRMKLYEETQARDRACQKSLPEV